jgi:hypothetical protein
MENTIKRPKLTNTRPVIKGNDLFAETEFNSWLEKEVELGNSVDRFIDCIKKYTYYVDKPFKGRADGRAHKYVFQYFWYKKTKKNKFKRISNIL